MNDPLKCIIVHMYKWEKAVYEKVALLPVVLNKYAHNFIHYLVEESFQPKVHIQKVKFYFFLVENLSCKISSLENPAVYQMLECQPSADRTTVRMKTYGFYS